MKPGPDFPTKCALCGADPAGGQNAVPICGVKLGDAVCHRPADHGRLDHQAMVWGLGDISWPSVAPEDSDHNVG